MGGAFVRWSMIPHQVEHDPPSGGYIVYNMRTTQGLMVTYGVAITILVLVTAGGYFLSLDPLSNNGFIQNFQLQEKINNSPEITIVTMYLNIGSFNKGVIGRKFTPATYKKWLHTWAWLTNPVIGFFDSDETLNTFRQIRSSQPENMTVVIKVNRTELSAFDNLEAIKKIYARPGYPRHHPNTVVAEYSCAMGAKYDALLLAITRDLVHTDYLTWMDIGYFRNLLRSNFHQNDDPFTLEVPDNFNSSYVGMSEVAPRTTVSKYSAWEYISSNTVWVAGGFVLGTKEAVWTFSESYKEMVTRLLEQNMISTDQQVIGAMYSPAYIQNQKVGIQSYICPDRQYGLSHSGSKYFCLGYTCKVSAENRRKDDMATISASKDKR